MCWWGCCPQLVSRAFTTAPSLAFPTGIAARRKFCKFPWRGGEDPGSRAPPHVYCIHCLVHMGNHAGNMQSPLCQFLSILKGVSGIPKDDKNMKQHTPPYLNAFYFVFFFYFYSFLHGNVPLYNGHNQTWDMLALPFMASQHLGSLSRYLRPMFCFEIRIGQIIRIKSFGNWRQGCRNFRCNRLSSIIYSIT